MPKFGYVDAAVEVHLELGVYYQHRRLPPDATCWYIKDWQVRL